MMSNGSNNHRNKYLEVSLKDYEYSRNLYSESRKGFIYTEEMKKKMSDSQKEKIGEKNSFYGRKHTEESKKKMSERAKNKVVSEETKKKMSIIRTGRKHTEESKKLMSEKMKGKKKIKVICDICNNEIPSNNILRHKKSCIIKNNVGDSH
jgi:predicted RND superfamily exporter protein